MAIIPPGTHIGSYEIVSHPMMGGMGVVYFCLDHANDARPVALKTFKPETLPDRAARDRFLREGTAWVQLSRHPHIVRCYEVKYIDPTAFLVLELIAKEQGMNDASLRSWIGAPMPVEQALLFALQIARGMKHATEKIPGFVHRDLKPENILVGADKLPGTNINRLRVTDFGLAAILKDEIGKLKDEDRPEAIRRTHMTHGIVGTPLYMAPEQWKGEAVGIYTDVYALGCILYEMLTGQYAAIGHSIRELQSAHCAGKLHSLPADTEWHGELQNLLSLSISVQPVQRCQSWDDMIRALEQVCKAHGLGSMPLVETIDIKSESVEERRQAGWSYNAMGLAYQDIGKAEIAVCYFEKALMLAREIGNRRGEAASLGNLGIAHQNLGEEQRAIGFYEKCLELHREISDRHGEGAALGNLGSVYARLGNAQRAIEFYEKGLVIAREIGDRHGEGVALGNMGQAYARLGDARRASGFFEKNLAIAREIGNRRGEGNALGNLGIAYQNLGDLRQAIEFYEQALVIAREIGDRRVEGAVLGNLGEAYPNLGDAQRAIELHEQRLAIAREIGDRGEEGVALGSLGGTYLKLSDAQRAIGFFEQCLVISHEIGDRRAEGHALGNLGLAYANLGKVRRAIGLYEQSLTIKRDIGDRRGEVGTLGNLGTAYKSLGDAQRAIEYTREALQISRETGDVVATGMLSTNLGMSLAQAGNINEAILLVKQAIQDFYQAGYHDHAQKAEGILAQFQRK